MSNTPKKIINFNTLNLRRVSCGLLILGAWAQSAVCRADLIPQYDRHGGLFKIENTTTHEGLRIDVWNDAITVTQFKINSSKKSTPTRSSEYDRTTGKLNAIHVYNLRKGFQTSFYLPPDIDFKKLSATPEGLLYKGQAVDEDVDAMPSHPRTLSIVLTEPLNLIEDRSIAFGGQTFPLHILSDQKAIPKPRIEAGQRIETGEGFIIIHPSSQDTDDAQDSN